MEHQDNEYDDEHEHEVYGGEIPDEEGEMDAEYDTSAAAESEDDPNAKELENMKKRLKEIEDEAGALREMQAKVEKEMGSAQGFTHLAVFFEYFALLTCLETPILT
ncbi:hypothetical protein H5410_016257 [Solanum commersonii]|uniref:Polyadenylate-binding protein 1-like n=1 Tax=Solanum commersonii TaxID=4109 RepID=A0A9J5ZVY6_SOLCO|nr:hypothetical protein H5410_016257 [Solanum commersonii]